MTQMENDVYGKLPLEYPSGEAFTIYVKRLMILSLVMLVNVLLLGLLILLIAAPTEVTTLIAAIMATLLAAVILAVVSAVIAALRFEPAAGHPSGFFCVCNRMFRFCKRRFTP